MKEFELGHEGNIGISKSKIFEIVEKAKRDYNLYEIHDEDGKFICEVNDKITIEFRNNNIVRKRKKKQYKYVLDVNCGGFGKGCVFNEYEEIKDILDSVQEIRKCD